MKIKPSVMTGIIIAAVGPVFHNAHPLHDCNPSIELCRVSDSANLPDEPAPKRAPAPQFKQTVVAGSTASAAEGMRA